MHYSIFKNENWPGSLKDFLANGSITHEWLDNLAQKVKDEAFEIISGKGITNFGIGENLAEITLAINNDRQSVHSLGVQLPKEYKNAGIYFGLPVVLGKDGYRHLPKIRLEEREQEMFDNYSKEIKDTVIEVMKNLKIKTTLK